MRQDKIPSTVGLNLAKVEKRRSKFVFWDVGGQSVLRKIWEKYYSQCNIVVFVVDGSDEERLDEAKQILQKLYSESLPTELVDLPILFLVNKSDHEHFLGIESVRERLGIGSLNCSQEIEVRKMSAKSQEGVKASVTWLYENIPLQQQQKLLKSSSQRLTKKSDERV